MGRPARTAGLRHVALFVEQFEACLDFYVRLMGMRIEWQPDPDNSYLTSGNDNLALHRVAAGHHGAAATQKLDHIGFVVDCAADVDDWHAFLQGEGVRLRTAPKTHRDGARSFYCEDPDGTVVQIIHHPPISGLRWQSVVE
ncbi:MAG TPA: VOC family protein [Pseudomonadales bacterium]|jgi:catechol 2,3-dioxygenase-like lactoylglutathione lyase family enzyme